jgi:hypothetical protein
MAQRSRKRRRRARRPAPRQRGADASADGASAGAVEQEPGAGRSRPERRREPRRPRYRDPDERPKPPWAPFPLVELMVLVSLGLLIAGFAIRGHRGTLMIAAGLVLGTLSGLELSIREHLAGYRSHTALLAGAIAIAVLVVLTLLVPSIPLILRLILAVAVFAASARFLVRVFQRRSGLSFRFR